MDYLKAVRSVADTISKAAKPLDEAQRMLLAGAMAVLLCKAAEEEREACAAICDEHALMATSTDGGEWASSCAEAIRTRSNAEFSGVPDGHSSNHHAGGTSAGTQG